MKSIEEMRKVSHMEYMEDMEQIPSDIMDKVINEIENTNFDIYTKEDVIRALNKDEKSIEDFKALLSPEALPFLEDMAKAATKETRKHFGNSIYLFTPLYISNYCENYCIYGYIKRWHVIRTKY